ncbi:MAG: ASCH/PUA domain-containing protein [Pseudomonadota bacterium]|nr:ASCH/PUA domain-containing protein [Pseudomonadota bacterium]
MSHDPNACYCGGGETSGHSVDCPHIVARPVRRHRLKTWPGPFRAVRAGLKPWELRRDDRGYEVGDTLDLDEWQPSGGDFTGERETRVVRWLLRGPAFGLPAGYVIMSLGPASGGGQ